MRELWSLNCLVSRVYSPFCSTLALFNHQLFSQGFGGFLERRIPIIPGKMGSYPIASFQRPPEATFGQNQRASAVESRPFLGLANQHWSIPIGRSQRCLTQFSIGTLLGEVRVRVPCFLSVVYFSSGTLPQKRNGKKGHLVGGPSHPPRMPDSILHTFEPLGNHGSN